MVGNRSPEYVQKYFFDTQAPRLSVTPGSGKFGNAIQVKILSSEPADIFYTLDNALPTRQSIPYRNAIAMTVSCTLKVIGIDPFGNSGDVVSAAYTIDTRIPVAAIFPEGGIFNKTTRVTFSVSEGARAFYSFDEFAPLSVYTPYTGPILLKPGQTIISYFAENDVGTRSNLMKKIFIVDMFSPKVDALAKDLGDKRGVILRANEKATFFYTLNGSPPSDKSKLYTGPIFIPKKGTVQLRVFARDMAGNTSDDFSQKFSYDVTPPTVTLASPGGVYNRPIIIQLIPNEPSRIFYTLDNTIPTETSPVYSDPFSLTREGKTVLTFFALDEGDNRSELYSVVYTLDQTPPTAKPKIERSVENKQFIISFTLQDDERLFYTLDGSDPLPNSPAYRQPLSVPAGTVLKYVAVDAAGNRTEVRTVSEIILPSVVATPTGGIFNRVTKVQLVANLPGRVYYRMESKRQGKGDFLEYMAPLVLNANGLYKLEYYSADQQGNQSVIHEESYLIDLFPPEIDVYTTRNPIESTITVHFQCSENATLYYTLDGSNPMVSPTASIIGNKYFRSKDKVVFKRAAEDVQMSFVGEDLAGNRSPLYQFDINLPTVMASPSGGEYNRILNVTLLTYNQATIYYTLDGTAPTERSSVYRQPIPVTKNAVFRYFAIDGFGYRGRIGESRYAIDLPPRPDFEVLSDTLMEGVPVVFDASRSVDEESDFSALLFQWNFTGDTLVKGAWSAVPRDTVVFRTPGVRRVTLHVKDAGGQTAFIVKRVSLRKDCSQDMVALTDGDRAFCMDRYEYPNIQDRLPLTGVTWVEAVMRCRNLGKNLCTYSEWEAACRGSRENEYPYGNAYRRERCNVESDRLLPAGTLTNCQSEEGVYDLTGNAWEWLEDRKDGYNRIVGGNYRYGRNARCEATFPNLLSSTDSTIGFRCCK
ncbi:MAG: hypothetical protein A2293_15185 [Elusimicrobia bacterium RIFOXYB2_FULL_49_7]|nr:MAG: hypothetical protein A2293_15185 [Elusimicrobia bacterium RIFOXYB2_FULL_49_7]